MRLMVRREGIEKVVVAKEGNSYSEKIENLLLFLRLLPQAAMRIEKKYEIKEGMKYLLF